MEKKIINKLSLLFMLSFVLVFGTISMHARADYYPGDDWELNGDRRIISATILKPQAGLTPTDVCGNSTDRPLITNATIDQGYYR